MPYRTTMVRLAHSRMPSKRQNVTRTELLSVTHNMVRDHFVQVCQLQAQQILRTGEHTALVLQFLVFLTVAGNGFQHVYL